MKKGKKSNNKDKELDDLKLENRAQQVQKNIKQTESSYDRLKETQEKNHTSNPQKNLDNDSQQDNKSQTKQSYRDMKQKRNDDILMNRKIKDHNKKQKDQSEKKYTKGQNDQYKLIFGLIFLTSFILFVKIQEEKYTREKKIRDKNSGDLKMDIYEVFQIDQKASQQEVRKQYNKLMVQYHPDKNPDCGQVCEDKFQKITEAYEILKDKEKRAAFDKNQGVINKIKSLAITITENNFNRLILEGNDLWIIQVYEDGDSFCEHISNQWESVIKEFKGSVKFGRIEKDDPAIHLLPLKIQVYPTIISWNGQDYYNLYTYKQNFFNTLSRFIIESLDSKIEKLSVNQIQNLQNTNKNPKILTFSQNIDKQYDVIYSSFKYQNFVEIYSNEINRMLSTQIDLKLQDISSQIYVNNQIYQIKKSEQNEVKIEYMINFIKSQMIIDLYQDNFSNICLGQGDTQIINFMIIKNQKYEQQLQEKAYETIEYYRQQALQNLQNNINLFQSYDILQFVKIDLQHNFKFNKLIQKVLLKNDQNIDNLIMIILQASQNKIQFLFQDGIANFEDQIDAFIHNENDLHNISENLDQEFYYYFQKESYGIYKQLIIDFIKNIFLLKLIIVQIIIYFSYFQFINPYHNKSIVMQNQAKIHVGICIFLSILNNLQDTLDYFM